MMNDIDTSLDTRLKWTHMALRWGEVGHEHQQHTDATFYELRLVGCGDFKYVTFHPDTV